MCTEQTFAWLSQYEKIYVQCSRHTISSFYELLCIKMHAYRCARKPLLPKLRKLGDSSTTCDNHIYIHRGFFFLLDSLLNCYILQGINLQHIPGPIYDALKVWGLWTTWVSWVSGDPSDCQIMTGYHVGRYCNYGHSMLGSVDCTGTGCKTCKQNQTSGNYNCHVCWLFDQGAYQGHSCHHTYWKKLLWLKPSGTIYNSFILHQLLQLHVLHP